MNEYDFLKKLEERHEENLKILNHPTLPQLLAPVSRYVGLNTPQFLLMFSLLVSTFMWIVLYPWVWEILRRVFLYV